MSGVVASVFPMGDQLFDHVPVSVEHVTQFEGNSEKESNADDGDLVNSGGKDGDGVMTRAVKEAEREREEDLIVGEKREGIATDWNTREKDLVNGFVDNSSKKEQGVDVVTNDAGGWNTEGEGVVTDRDASVNLETRKGKDPQSGDGISEHFHEENGVSSQERWSKGAQNDGSGQSVASAQVKHSAPSLKAWLNFSKTTAVNFMHFHKTGGVSFKTALHRFYDHRSKANGELVKIQDACYVREGVKEEGQPTFEVWRCDWGPIREQSEEERNKLDFVFGHQFKEDGVDELLNKRDLRTFTIMRHPFDRKVSFFYHFFVREVGRKEEDVSFEEIRDFLLFDRLRIEADLGRDLGPNYMASRLLSDGFRGFVGNISYSYFAVEHDEREKVVDGALGIVREYIFVGLQSQPQASQCMLRKVMEEFNDLNGVSNEGTEQVDEEKTRLNSGSYSMSAKVIWGRFSPEDRMLFGRKEGVDLSIYEEGERLFKKHVEIYGCTHRLVG